MFIVCEATVAHALPVKSRVSSNKTSPRRSGVTKQFARQLLTAFNYSSEYSIFILITPTHVYCIIIVSSFIAGERREMLPSLIASPLPRNLGPLSESASFVSPVHIYLFSLFILL